MSMVRFLVYSNEFDVEGLVAVTSTWMRNRVRPDVIQHGDRRLRPGQADTSGSMIRGFRAPEALNAVVAAGQPGFGMSAVGADKMSDGAALIIRAADKADDRPLWISMWGGANTLAQALAHVRDTRTPEQLDAFIARLRVYSISDQDDAGPWIRREFPLLHYIAMPSTPDGDQYYQATWTGISGDRFYKNAPGADFTTFTDDWVTSNIRSKGPLGKLYPYPCCIHEGDTPSFLGLINNGLASFMSPTYGGWGGRYVWRQFYGETRPMWTQGGDSFPGRDNSRDTVTGVDGKTYTSDQATIWRWRTRLSTRFCCAHGLDDQGRRPRQPQPRCCRERSGWQGTHRNRRASRCADDGRRRWHSRSGWQRADILMVRVSGSRHGHSRTSGGDRARGAPWVAAVRPRPGAFRRHQAAARASRRRGSRSRTQPPRA